MADAKITWQVYEEGEGYNDYIPVRNYTEEGRYRI